MADKDDISMLIERQMRRLLASFERCHYGTEDDIVQAYHMATLSFPRSVVSQALQNYLAGNVWEHDPAALPTAIQLAAECKIVNFQREAEDFDIGGAMAELVSADVDGIQRGAALAAKQANGSRILADLQNVIPLRPHEDHTVPGGAA